MTLFAILLVISLAIVGADILMRLLAEDGRNAWLFENKLYAPITSYGMVLAFFCILAALFLVPRSCMLGV